MLSRSNFSIRRLISQRRPRGPDDDADEEDMSFFDHDDVEERRDSATLQVPSESMSRRRGRKDPVVIRRTQSIHRISGPLPSPPPLRLRSASSLGCYDEGIDISRRASGIRKSVRGQRSFESDDGQLSSSSSSSHQHASPSQGWLQPHPASSPLPSPRLWPDAHDDDNDTRATSPGSGEQRPARPARDAIDDESLLDITQNVQQLIRETDLAFRKVGSSLAETRRASDSFAAAEAAPHLQHHQQHHHPRHAQRPPKPLRLRAVLQRQQQQQQLQHPPTTTEPTTAQRPASDAGVPRTAAGQITGFPANREQVPAEAERTLTASGDSATAPGEPGRTTEEDDEDDANEGSETPVEPFHLEDLPSRVRAAGVKTTLSPVDGPTLPASFDQIVRRDFSLQRKKPPPAPLPLKQPPPQQRGIMAQSNRRSGIVVDAMTFKMLSFPSPPLKNPLRLVARPQLPPLPTIPEVMVSSPQDEKAASAAAATLEKQRADQGGDIFTPVHGNGFVMLRSSPYTLNVPTFRHGPIRLPKGTSAKELALRRDDTLDWTAFQMAILGGAGELFDECDDEFFAFGRRRRDAVAEEMDEIAHWFDGFGFESPGLLVPEEFAAAQEAGAAGQHSGLSSPASSPRSSATSQASAPSSTAESSPVSWAKPGAADDDDGAANLPIPVEHEHPSGFWNEGDCDGAGFYAAPGVRRWAGEGHPKRYGPLEGADARASVDSLPQSPLMDLVLSRGANGEVNVVPMGYNLHHDLGDFLRWEAENVYAGSF